MKKPIFYLQKTTLTFFVLFLSVLLLLGSTPKASANTAVSPAYSGITVKGDRHQAYLGYASPKYYMVNGENLTFTILGQGLNYSIEYYDTSKLAWVPFLVGKTLDDGNKVTTRVFKWNQTHNTAYGNNLQKRASFSTYAKNWAYTTPTQVFYTSKLGYKVPAQHAGHWNLIMTSDNNFPARWNPCEYIDVRVDFRNLQRGTKAAAINDVKSNLAYLNSNTGMQFRYVGEVQSDEDLTKLPAKGVDIFWTNNPKTSSKAMPGGDGVPRYNAKYQSLNRGKVVVTVQQDTSTSARARVLRHELIHVLGANHTDLNGNIMGPSNTVGVEQKYYTFGTIDNEYAKVLGVTAGCY